MNLGVCKLYLLGGIIEGTLEEKDVSLKIEPITKDVKTDDSGEVKGQEETGIKATLKFSVPYTKENITLLGLSGMDMNLTKNTELIIEPINNLVIITMYKACLKITQSLDFSGKKYGIIDIIAIALNDSLDRKINIVIN